ncbi:unnamed protein product, partial [Musa textilis]
RFRRPAEGRRDRVWFPFLPIDPPFAFCFDPSLERMRRAAHAGSREKETSSCRQSVGSLKATS